MQLVKQEIYSLVETLPSAELLEVTNFILFVKKRHEDRLRK